MTCEEVREALPDYALGTLSETETASVRRHLRGCSTCRSQAAELDEGVSLFARAAHAAEPPTELKDRVMAVLSEEWEEASSAASAPALPLAHAPAPRGTIRRFAGAWQAVAALVIVLAGVATWGGVAQSRANHFREDASNYRSFLGALGGKDVRVGRLEPTSSQVTLDGSVVMYDSERGQSWVLVLARAPGVSDPLAVALEGSGRTIKMPFPLKFDPDGEGSSWLVTAADISGFDRVVLTDPAGHVVAEGHITSDG